MKKSILFLAALLVLTACHVKLGDKDDEGGGGGGTGTGTGATGTRVNWESVPAKFNPTTEDLAFDATAVDRVYVSTFGSSKEEQLIYSPDIPAGQGYVRLFKVSSGSAVWPIIASRKSGERNLELMQNGNYSCQIRIVDGQITELDGGCFVRIQIVVGNGSQVEIYSNGQLLSKRFVPIDNETFLKNLDSAFGVEKKKLVIDEFLNSYSSLGKTASITTEILGKVIQVFAFSDDKFAVLGKLQALINDRDNLAAMIEREFTYFDREKARRIVGL